jgi:Fe-S cluster assembly protein SufD
MSTIEFWLAEHRRQSPDLPGAKLPWLAALRARAITRFAEAGWPTRREENWHHTSLEFMQRFVLAGAAHTAPQSVLRTLQRTDSDAHWLVFVDGRYAPDLSAIGALPAGAHIGSLADALAQDAEQVKVAFAESCNGDIGEEGEAGDSPAALNTAFAADGAWIHLASGVVVDQPIHIVCIFAGTSHRHLRHLICAEAGARVSVAEHYPANEAAPTLTTAITRIKAGADSRIEHFKLQQENRLAIHLAGIDVEQARGARFASHSLSFGARLARTDIHTRLAGEGAEALLNGLYCADGETHVDHHTRIEHAKPLGLSREYYRGLLAGHAHGVFAGRIIVAPDAQQTDALQRCDSLLLSPFAKSDTRPELEIHADDVKCAHGATVGQLDEEAQFYLRSRGINAAEARQWLTYAFASTALERIASAPLQELACVALRALLHETTESGDKP